MKKLEIYELKTSALHHLKGGAADLNKTKTVNGVTKDSRHDKDSVPDQDVPPKELVS